MHSVVLSVKYIFDKIGKTDLWRASLRNGIGYKLIIFTAKNTLKKGNNVLERTL